MKGAEKPTSDLVLLRKTGQKNQAAFEELYRRYEQRIYRFVVSKCWNPAEADDIFHDVMMTVWRNASEFKGKSTVASWMFAIAYRKLVDRHREIERQRRYTLLSDPHNLPNDQFDQVLAKTQARNIRGCVEKLTTCQRQVVELAFYQDLSYPIIADKVQVPEGTVKTRIHYAKKKLRYQLKRDGWA